jgi:hypothetical protein
MTELDSFIKVLHWRITDAISEAEFEQLYEVWCSQSDKISEEGVCASIAMAFLEDLI